jgi:hypothetical protein
LRGNTDLTVLTLHDSYFGEGDAENQPRNGVTGFMVCDHVATNRIRLHIFHAPFIHRYGNLCATLP